MIDMMRVLELGAFALLICSLCPALGENLLSCETTSPDASGYRCNINRSPNSCETFAILRTNSYFSSLSNLSIYLGFSRFAVAKANGFAADTEFLSKGRPLLIPIGCKCVGRHFQAEVTKTTIKGESFYGIAESLEGLTTCEAIREKNPRVSPWTLDDKVKLLVPLRCACSNASEARLLLSYAVNEGDTISKLAIDFNITPEAIVSANRRSLETFRPESLIPHTSLLIPLNGEPNIDTLVKPWEPGLSFPAGSIPVITRGKKKSKVWMIGVYIGIAGAAIVLSIAIAAAFLVFQLKKKKQQYPSKEQDLELQQVSLSIGTTSDKKVSFGSQDALDGQIIGNTPRKALLESYALEELRKSTGDFDSSNLIEGCVYLGRLNGKNLAIKRTRTETMSKIEFGLFNSAICDHQNIIRLLGTCLAEGGREAFLVFEYAENGTLKDWLHGGLAIKSQFIASCYCFLTWNQRLKICLDVAVALQYMHHIMNPSYVHRNVKSGNIFLGEDFSAKIGNFGMARCSEDEIKDLECRHSVNPTSSNLGYLAPEYIQRGIVSAAMDIFAYGVVVLEVLSGQTPITEAGERGEGRIWQSEKIKAVLGAENADGLREWMDGALGENYSFEEAVTLANLARSCVEEDPCLRPSAGEIVEKLIRLMEESPEEEGVLLVCESSSKPLVKAAAASRSSV